MRTSLRVLGFRLVAVSVLGLGFSEATFAKSGGGGSNSGRMASGHSSSVGSANSFKSASAASVKSQGIHSGVSSTANHNNGSHTDNKFVSLSGKSNSFSASGKNGGNPSLKSPTKLAESGKSGKSFDHHDSHHDKDYKWKDHDWYSCYGSYFGCYPSYCSYYPSCYSYYPCYESCYTPCYESCYTPCYESCYTPCFSTPSYCSLPCKPYTGYKYKTNFSSPSHEHHPVNSLASVERHGPRK